MICECMDSGALNSKLPSFPLWGEDLLVQLEAQRKTDQTETERLRSHVEVGMGGWSCRAGTTDPLEHAPKGAPKNIHYKVV